MSATASIELGGRHFVVGGRVIRVARLAGEGFDFLHDLEGFVTGLGAGRPRADLLTVLPPVREARLRHPYHVEWDNVAALPLRTFDDWWTHQIDNRVRNRVRVAARRGVTAREVAFDDTLVQGISGVYDESRVRQGQRFTHYGKDAATVRAENASFLDRAVFFGAFLDGALIGFAKIVLDEGQRQAGVMQFLAMLRHRDKSPANALLAEVIRGCAGRGVEHLVYSTFGVQPLRGLNDFKVVNGFHRIDLPRYYVPLTMRGQLTLGARLHRRLAERLPAPVIAALKALRTAWYTRQLAR